MSHAFTVVVPCHNGGAHLRECIAGILAQQYDNFDVAVVENGSTDGSLEWLQSLSDPRVKVYPAPPLDIVGNWARIMTVPRREFMTIIGHDDRLDPNYLAVMDGLIDRYPDAGLYHAHFRFIDRNGGVIRSCGPLPERETAAGYISDLYARNRDTYGSGYVMRTAAYDAAGGIPHHERLLYADDALWVTMMHRSYKAVAAQECFDCRIHPTSMGASAPWRSWLSGMKSYIPFLKRIAGEDPEFAAALAQHGPTYFLWHCRALYQRAVVQATQQNRRVEPGAFEEIAEVLRSIAPEKLPEYQAYKDSRGYRLRDIINRLGAARLAYNLYVLARHGEWRGRQVR